MNVITFVAIILIIAFSIISYQYCKYTRESLLAKEKSILDFDFTNGFAFIDYLMDTELSYSVELPFEGKDIKRVTDFEEVLLNLTNNVTGALNPTFIEKMDAQGVSEEYIYEYITRGCTIRLMNYMKENIAPSKNENDEEE